jgi:uncharacterized RDD family membrane protein YckC
MEPIAGASVRTDGLTDSRAEKNVTVLGIGPRLGARLIDTFLIAILSFIVAIVGGLVGTAIGMFSPNSSAWASFFTVAAGLVFSFIYYIGAWANSGQTLGDTLLGVKIVTTHGTRLSMGQAIVRYIGYLISAAVLSLGFLWIAFDKKRQGWHDKMGGSVAISAQQYFSDEDRVTFVPADQGRTAVWIIAWAVMAILWPGALFGGLLSLGPFVGAVIRALRGG